MLRPLSPEKYQHPLCTALESMKCLSPRVVCSNGICQTQSPSLRIYVRIHDGLCRSGRRLSGATSPPLWGPPSLIRASARVSHAPEPCGPSQALAYTMKRLVIVLVVFLRRHKTPVGRVTFANACGITPGIFVRLDRGVDKLRRHEFDCMVMCTEPSSPVMRPVVYGIFSRILLPHFWPF